MIPGVLTALPLPAQALPIPSPPHAKQYHCTAKDVARSYTTAATLPPGWWSWGSRKTAEYAEQTVTRN